jgi:CHAT domain-containing protein
MSKRQSLQSAQEYLRIYKNEKGEQCYNMPKYWAAFILLDGIDKN